MTLAPPPYLLWGVSGQMSLWALKFKIQNLPFPDLPYILS